MARFHDDPESSLCTVSDAGPAPRPRTQVAWSRPQASSQDGSSRSPSTQSALIRAARQAAHSSDNATHGDEADVAVGTGRHGNARQGGARRRSLIFMILFDVDLPVFLS